MDRPRVVHRLVAVTAHETMPPGASVGAAALLLWVGKKVMGFAGPAFVERVTVSFRGSGSFWREQPGNRLTPKMLIHSPSRSVYDDIQSPT